MEANEQEEVNLGDKIVVVGFRDVGRDNFTIVKKMIGNYYSKAETHNKKIIEFKVYLKGVHESQGKEAKKYEIHASANINGKEVLATITDFNLFVSLDKVLSKLLTEIEKV